MQIMFNINRAHIINSARTQRSNYPSACEHHWPHILGCARARLTCAPVNNHTAQCARNPCDQCHGQCAASNNNNNKPPRKVSPVSDGRACNPTENRFFCVREASVCALIVPDLGILRDKATAPSFCELPAVQLPVDHPHQHIHKFTTITRLFIL